MDTDYYEVTSQLDAREILRYLNNLGIHNISGEVLKYFITDRTQRQELFQKFYKALTQGTLKAKYLKKLIKYDLENRNKTARTNEKEDIPGLERLHSASTFSSRTRSKLSDGAVLTCTRECQKKRKVLTVRNFQSATNLVHHEGDKHLRRACSCVRVERKPESRAESGKEKTSSNYNIIKVPKLQTQKKCDPVSLYHYYTSLWAKYKPNVPGENDWSDLRWSIRQKMAGCEAQQSSSKASDIQSQDKVGRTSKR